jgi:membrane-associated phospholipid phosphatase
MAFDPAIFLYFQEQLKARPWYRRFWVFWSLYGVGYIVAAIIILSASARGRAVIPGVVIAYFITWPIIAHACYFFYKKQRPYQVIGFVPFASSRFFSRPHHKQNSFPSRHTMAMVAVSMAVIFDFPLLGSIGLVASSFVGLGRIVLGYHYPNDVYAGALIGIVVGIISHFYLAPVIFT